MKQCPQCLRTYYDETLNYCLEDGETLVYGPPTEADTAVLHSASTGEAPTLLHSADPNVAHPALRKSVAARYGRWVWLFVLVPLVFAGPYLAYRAYAPAPSRQINTIAVLPIANETANPDMDYLSDGLTESLIASLSQLPQLSVKARSSVFRYKGGDVDLKKAGSDLGVEALLTGRMTQRGAQVRVDVELVEAATERVLWTSNYRRSTTDLAALEGDLSTAIAGQLRARITGAETEKVARLHTDNPEAYELYLKAQHPGGEGQDRIERAIELYKLSIERDPNFALAYVGLAAAYMGLGGVFGYESPRNVYPLARDALQKALTLNPDLAQAHAGLAVYYLYYDWNWETARQEFETAIRLDPNDSSAHEEYGTYLESIGRFDEAVRERELARKLDPLSPGVAADVGYPLYYSRRQPEAIERFRKALEIDPDYPWALLWIGQSQLELRQYPDAFGNIDKAMRLSGGGVVRIIATRGYAFAVSGRRADALKTIDELKMLSKEKYVSPYFFAVIYSGLGDKDEAFRYLDQAVTERHPYLMLINVEPVFDNLRSDPRFAATITKIGIPH